jgi:hypothetical protein
MNTNKKAGPTKRSDTTTFVRPAEYLLAISNKIFK